MENKGTSVKEKTGCRSPRFLKRIMAKKKEKKLAISGIRGKWGVTPVTRQGLSRQN